MVSEMKFHQCFGHDIFGLQNDNIMEVTFKENK
jgi:hypothetical protein